MTEQRMVTVYKVAELSDTAKDKALGWIAEGALDFDWWESDVDYWAEQMSALYGVDVATRTVKLHGGGTRQEPDVSFAAERGHDWWAGWSSSSVDVKRLILSLPEGYKRYRALYMRADSMSLSVAFGAVRMGARGERVEVCVDYYEDSLCQDYPPTAREQRVMAWAEYDAKRLQDELGQWASERSDDLLDGLESDADYRGSEEALLEDAECNGWLFTATGEFWAYSSAEVSAAA